jgi:hypothetical protein
MRLVQDEAVESLEIALDDLLREAGSPADGRERAILEQLHALMRTLRRGRAVSKAEMLFVDTGGRPRNGNGPERRGPRDEGTGIASEKGAGLAFRHGENATRRTPPRNPQEPARRHARGGGVRPGPGGRVPASGLRKDVVEHSQIRGGRMWRSWMIPTDRLLGHENFASEPVTDS